MPFTVVLCSVGLNIAKCVVIKIILLYCCIKYVTEEKAGVNCRSGATGGRGTGGEQSPHSSQWWFL